MTKYDALYRHLKSRGESEIVLKFTEIERIINASLPPSARKHSVWWTWANRKHPASTPAQINAWTDAGWTALPDIKSERVKFNRIGTAIQRNPAPGRVRIESSNPNMLQEDEIKEILRDFLTKQGWTLDVAFGREHGIDIEAIKDQARWVIEVKGCGSRDAMRVNYFLMILGELLQRMTDPSAKYSIALPDLPQFRRLWERLPRLAKERSAITCLFIRNNKDIQEAN